MDKNTALDDKGPTLPDLDGKPARGEGGALRLFYSIVTLVALLLLCAPFMTDTTAKDAPAITDGVIDFSQSDALDQPVALEGDWLFDWNDALETPATREVQTAFLPGLWTSSHDDLPRSGRATYRLDVKGIKPGNYTLYIPAVFNASEVSLNGEVVSGRGRLGTSRDDTEYYVRSQQIHFEAQSDPLVIEIEVAAFLHKDNGLEAPPVIGKRAAMDDWAALRWSRETLYHATLLLLVCLNISVFIIRRSDKSVLYLAIAAFAFMTPAGIAGFDNLLLLVAPSLTFQQMSLINSISLTIAPVGFFAYSQALYPDETPRWVAWPIYVLIPLFGVVHAVIIGAGFTLEASLLQTYMAYFNLSAIAAIAVIGFRAMMNRRTGGALFFISLAGFVFIFGMNAMISTGVFRESEIPAYSIAALNPLLLLFSQVIIMAERWGDAITEMEDRNLELTQLLDINTSISTEIELSPLLRKIVGVTSEVIAADRSSLFIYNPVTDELVSTVAQGMDGHEIRLSPDQGIAGACLRSKEPIFVADAYADDRFDSGVDEDSGYRTQSILAVPILSKDGKPLGVMQALNREGGRPFVQSDLIRAKAFASQAAIAIENANLFEEVVAERNYNDSILSSLRNGVITIDKRGKVMKSNAAAQSILSRGKDDFEDGEISVILKLKNENLDGDLRKTLKTGEPSSLFDVDLVSPQNQSAKSVNLTVSPLIRGANAGDETLIVLEDISESKRLNSTLRRFMPQEIVDEVLSKDTDALFGSALDASILFADIRRFTSLSEELTARATVDMLNEVFSDLCEAISATEGVVDKFIGDAIMAVYGVPLSRENNAELAVNGGLAILRALRVLNERRLGRGQAELSLGVGISTGEVVAGTIGSQKRMDYTVIGDTVNLASRLESATKDYGVGLIISERTAEQLGDGFRLRQLDKIKVRGRQASTTLFEVLDPDDIASCPEMEELLARYEAGRRFYEEGDIERAQRSFADALKVSPHDGPSKVMLDRMEGLAMRPASNS